MHVYFTHSALLFATVGTIQCSYNTTSQNACLQSLFSGNTHLALFQGFPLAPMKNNFHQGEGRDWERV